MNTQQAAEKLDRYIRARYPVIAVLSHEERRVLQAVCAVAGQRGRQVYAWTITHGLRALTGRKEFENSNEPIAALEAMLTEASMIEADPDHNPPAVFVLCDLHPYLGDPMIVRYLRDVAARFETCRHTLVLLSPALAIPADLEKTAVLIDWPLPGRDELSAILEQCERDLPARIPVTLNGSRAAVVQAMSGLTQFEAGSVLLSAIAATGEMGDSAIPHIVAEKAQIVRRSGLLEYFATDVTMAHVGGLPYLKQYADVKRSTFRDDARLFGLEPARGVLLLGLPGTGKSLAAKAIAGGKRPLLRMDIGALMGSLVGQSEANFRAATKVAEAVAPCVVWLDEIEKALGTGGDLDGGVSSRMLGAILTWMQETTAPIYFVATANDVRALRPELIARFDDVLFVDLPNQADRAEVLAVHLRKRGRDPQAFDLERVAAATRQFVGRELERVVRSALETAFFNNQELTTDHLVQAAGQIVPIAVTMDAQIQDLRAWAKNRASRANDPLEPRPSPADTRSRSADL